MNSGTYEASVTHPSNFFDLEVEVSYREELAGSGRHVIHKVVLVRASHNVETTCMASYRVCTGIDGEEVAVLNILNASEFTLMYLNKEGGRPFAPGVVESGLFVKRIP